MKATKGYLVAGIVLLVISIPELLRLLSGNLSIGPLMLPIIGVFCLFLGISGTLKDKRDAEARAVNAARDPWDPKV
jgi:hypothetical protein